MVIPDLGYFFPYISQVKEFFFISSIKHSSKLILKDISLTKEINKINFYYEFLVFHSDWILTLEHGNEE